VTIDAWADGTLAGIPRTTADQRHRAARRIATEAVNATEAAELLDMLGLTAHDGLRRPAAESGPALRESA
jgi:hypothetical protein